MTSHREVRSWGLTMLLVGAIVGWVLHRHGFAWGRAPAIAAASGAALLSLSWVVPSWMAPIARGWMVLGHALGRVTTPVVLVLMFVVVFVPLRVALALAGRDVLARRRDPAAKTYWTARTRTRFSLDDFRRLV